MDGYRQNADMQDLAHATAHLIHGSSEGRFTITYAPGHLTAAEIEGVNFRYADLAATLARYQPEKLKEGWNTAADGERFFFIPTPSAGLWATRALRPRPAPFGGTKPRPRPAAPLFFGSGGPLPPPPAPLKKTPPTTPPPPRGETPRPQR